MSENTNQTMSQDEMLKHKKIAHDYYASAIQVLTTRVQFFHEEFEGIFQTVQFLRNIRDQIKKEIEEIEPPTKKTEEKAKPYVMDLTHVKGE